MKYRKKPIVIDAIQYDADQHYQKLADWGLCWKTVHDTRMIRCPHIHTLEGVHHISDGAWIIKGVIGEFYSCRSDVFKVTYEKVDGKE